MVDFGVRRASGFRSLLTLCLVTLFACATTESVPYRDRCQLDYLSRRLELALANCSQAIEAYPTDSRMYVLRGNVYDDLGRGEDGDRRRREEALADYNSALRVNPQSAFAYRNRSVFHFRRNNFDQAFVDADSAVKLDPKYPLAYLSRSCALQGLGRTDDAEEDRMTYQRLVGEQPPKCP